MPRVFPRARGVVSRIKADTQHASPGDEGQRRATRATTLGAVNGYQDPDTGYRARRSLASSIARPEAVLLRCTRSERPRIPSGEARCPVAGKDSFRMPFSRHSLPFSKNQPSRDHDRGKGGPRISLVKHLGINE